PPLAQIFPEIELFCDNNMPKNQGNVIPNTHLRAESSTPFLSKLGISFSRFLHDVLTKQNSGRAEYLAFLHTWLDDRFGTLTDTGKNELTHENKLENQLAKQVSWFLHADITTLYRYDYGQESLKTLGLYCSTQRDEWLKKVPLQMEVIHSDQKKRQKSICYRCIDTEEIRFCRDFDPNNPQKTEPPGETLLDPPDNLVSHKSGLAAPILVHNRVWGVVEILGSRPHQFRWDDRRFISEVSETLSTFFYHQWLLQKLQELNKIAVNEMATPPGYGKICKCLAELLISHGAAVWIYEPQEGGYYKCKGVYQRDWEQIPPLKDERIYLNDKDAVIMYTREAQKQQNWQGWWEKYLDELPESWGRMHRNQPLTTKGINTIACIPILSSQQGENAETIAYIVLYNKIRRKYDERWKHYFAFVARYTASVLEAIQAQTEWERRSRSFIRHEIRSNVNQISDRTSEIKRFYQKDFTEQRADISRDFLRRYDLLIGDLETYARYLQDDVGYLTEKNFAKYLYSSSPIIQRAEDRIESEKPEWIDLRQAFNTHYRAAWSLQKKKHLYVDYPISGHVHLIRIHEYNLRHILANLCDNAIKYAMEGSLINVTEVKINGDLEWTIRNTGQCLIKDEHYRIFKEGIRGSNAKNEQGEGKGLFLVEGICKLYGFAVRYQSELTREGWCRHSFILSFPAQMIREEHR
ncbi:MAG: ATP-binding protein, partial [Thiotrichaceae bacterium]